MTKSPAAADIDVIRMDSNHRESTTVASASGMLGNDQELKDRSRDA